MLRLKSKTRKHTWDNVKAKIQDNKSMSGSKSSIRKYTQDDIKAKIQDKEAHLKQCQDNYSEQGSKIKNNVSAKIQDK